MGKRVRILRGTKLPEYGTDLGGLTGELGYHLNNSPGTWEVYLDDAGVLPKSYKDTKDYYGQARNLVYIFQNNFEDI